VNGVAQAPGQKHVPDARPADNTDPCLSHVLQFPAEKAFGQARPMLDLSGFVRHGHESYACGTTRKANQSQDWDAKRRVPIQHRDGRAAQRAGAGTLKG
jgi:hypothetical protein